MAGPPQSRAGTYNSRVSAITNVVALGLNHTTAPLDLRGRLAFRAGMIRLPVLRDESELRRPVAWRAIRERSDH